MSRFVCIPQSLEEANSFLRLTDFLVRFVRVLRKYPSHLFDNTSDKAASVTHKGCVILYSTKRRTSAQMRSEHELMNMRFNFLPRLHFSHLLFELLHFVLFIIHAIEHVIRQGVHFLLDKLSSFYRRGSI